MKENRIKFSKEELKEAKCQYKTIKRYMLKKFPREETEDWGFVFRVIMNTYILQVIVIIIRAQVAMTNVNTSIDISIDPLKALLLYPLVPCALILLFTILLNLMFKINYYYERNKYMTDNYMLHLKNKNLKLLEKEVLYKNQDITKELKAHKSPYKRIAYINRLGNKI